jgi:hypothetical protein
MVPPSSTVAVCGYQDCITRISFHYFSFIKQKNISFHYFYIEILWCFQLQAREAPMEIGGENKHLECISENYIEKITVQH